LIKYFAIENYRSVKKECVIDFDLNIPKNNPFPANTIIGFAGANASGKTTVLQALTFVIRFMQSSFLTDLTEIESPEDFEEFITNVTNCQSFYGLESEPTKFHLIFSKKTKNEQEEKFIDYEYILHITREQILYEELNYYPLGRKRVVYIRNLSNVKFGNHVKSIGTKDLRKNSSIVSFATLYNSQTIALECKNYIYYSNLYQNDNIFYSGMIAKLLEDDNLSNQLSNFIKMADFGIDSIFTKKEREVKAQNISAVLPLFRDTNNESRKKFIDDFEEDESTVTFSIKTLLFKHKIGSAPCRFYCKT
jgi:AAA15 family ATPase/GTPase